MAKYNKWELLERYFYRSRSSSCQGSDTRVIPKKPDGFFWGKPVEKSSKEPAPNLIQFQFVLPVIVKDFFVYSF